jgi:hypothetical protein
MAFNVSGRTAQAVLVLALLFLCVLSGCGGSRLLTNPPPVAVRTAGNEENDIQLFERHYRIDPVGRATVRTHSILRVGSEGTERNLAVFDGSMMRLTAYEARIVHADGSRESYDIGDLGSSTLSNDRVVAERSLRHVSVRQVPHPGDLIESVSEHELALPQLGISFSPGEAGNRVLHASCVIEFPRTDTLLTLIVNDTLGTSPSITRTEVSTLYRFVWDRFRSNENRHRFARRNDAPMLFAIFPSRGPKSWEEFGDWYLGVIAGKLWPDNQITAAAKGIVNEQISDREKMFAIARYCQSSIRYEQVYLEGGEMIPNEAALIFQHRYGDCKDYSTLMVVMARVVGLNPDLVLCWRGSGNAFCSALPVNQFNHMIVHFRSGDKDFWFDGTNPPEAIGVAADDMINGTALILEPGASRLATIGESPENLLSVSGTLNVRGDDLAGKVTIRLQGQYAVSFFTTRRWANPNVMNSSLLRWIQGSVASNVTVSDLVWRVEDAAFVVDVTCMFPNALWRVGGGQYVRFDRIFNKLLPQEEPGLDPDLAFYYPGYARVKVDVTIPEFLSLAGDGEFRWEDRFVLPVGPFDELSRADFLQKYRSEVRNASRVVRLKRKGEP